MKNEFEPDWTVHPKETIIELISELIEKQSDFKKEEIEKLIKGELEIDDKIAQKLENLFKISKIFWLNRQKKYDKRNCKACARNSF